MYNIYFANFTDIPRFGTCFEIFLYQIIFMAILKNIKHSKFCSSLNLHNISNIMSATLILYNVTKTL